MRDDMARVIVERPRIPAFNNRKGRRQPLEDMPHHEGMRRTERAAFVDQPDTILQELVQTAVDLCGADSAGISIEPSKQGRDRSPATA